jgi:hypothetical protein
MYFNYWLDKKAGGLRSPDVTAPLNGKDNYLGQALDLYMDIPLGKEFKMSNKTMESLSSRFVIGGFKAGDAYGNADDEYIWRGTAELRVRF